MYKEWFKESKKGWFITLGLLVHNPLRYFSIGGTVDWVWHKSKGEGHPYWNFDVQLNVMFVNFHLYFGKDKAVVS